MAQGERLICASDALREGGTGVRFAVHRGGAALPAFAVRHRGAVRAYINECRHQGTELDWSPGDFFDAERLYLICATHGAIYAPDTGYCVAGACRGERLAPVAVCERDGGIYCSED